MEINCLSPIRDPQSTIYNFSNPRSAICNQKSLQSAINDQQSSISGGLMDAEELKARTKHFGLRVIKLVEALPSTPTAHTIGNQLLRAGTSVGANYRSACRGRSKAEFVAKIGISIEEADECLYWMELLIEAGIIPEERLTDLMREANELIAILITSAKTARTNLRKRDAS
jgi:four helix bundle protein